MDPSVLKHPQGMDPHQRVVLEVGYEACHHAGYSKGKLMNKIGQSLSLCSPIRFSSQDSFSWQNLRWFDHLRFSISKRFSKVAFILAAARASTAPNSMLFQDPQLSAANQGPFSEWCQKWVVQLALQQVSIPIALAFASRNVMRWRPLALNWSFSCNLHSPWTFSTSLSITDFCKTTSYVFYSYDNQLVVFCCTRLGTERSQHDLWYRRLVLPDCRTLGGWSGAYQRPWGEQWVPPMH